MNLSAVIIARNEEKNIKQCIKSLAFCDEVVVIDDYSTDKTAKLSRQYAAKVYKRKLRDDFSGQRNFGLKKAKGKWVLFVDADERVPKELANEIIQVVNDPLLPYSGCFLKRKDTFLGKELRYGEAGNITLLRLAKKDKGKWIRRVHEIWQVEGKKYTLKHALVHYSHNTLKEFVKDINYYSTLHARANLKEGKKVNIMRVIFMPVLKFKLNFILKRGFLDRAYGFVHAMLMSFHSFLAWSKLWLLQKK